MGPGVPGAQPHPAVQLVVGGTAGEAGSATTRHQATEDLLALETIEKQRAATPRTVHQPANYNIKEMWRNQYRSMHQSQTRTSRCGAPPFAPSEYLPSEGAEEVSRYQQIRYKSVMYQVLIVEEEDPATSVTTPPQLLQASWSSPPGSGGATTTMLATPP